MSSVWKMLMRFLHSSFVLNRRNLACILNSQYTSIWTKHIASAQWLYVASGYSTGQCSAVFSLLMDTPPMLAKYDSSYLSHFTSYHFLTYLTHKREAVSDLGVGMSLDHYLKTGICRRRDSTAQCGNMTGAGNLSIYWKHSERATS